MMDEKEQKKLQPRQVIKCPYCGYEHLPCEVLYPENVVGQSDNIVRDALGKIIYVDYKEDEEPLAEEVYVCDGCGREFVVEVETKYKARPQDECLDFTQDTASLI